MEDKPKISNTEWGLVIGALFMVDMAQIVIEWSFVWLAGASIFINFFIDLWVGMSLALYLHWRGQSVANPKRLFGILATFGFEIWPAIDQLPLWTFDGIYNMLIYKSESLVKYVPLAQKVAKYIPGADKFIDTNTEKDKSA
jgi:hypothetical protein